MDADLICYQFSRPNVEKCDFEHFLSFYSPDKLPSGRPLQQMMGTFWFAITGYDDDARELSSIPDVRRFYAAFHQAWPYWLYFCDLQEDRLKLMVFCCLNNLATLKVDGRANYATEFSPRDLIRFISDDFVPMNELCERANMTERQIYDRSRSVFEYFGFSFNAPPPP
jgi:hypothetical protein